MSKRRLSAGIAGLVIFLALITRVVVAGSGGAGAVAVDTTGAEPTVAPEAASSLAQTIPGTAAATPLLVLSPNSARPGGGIRVWGRGFPSGATINIYLKQNASDVVNPVTVVEADQNGQFGGITVSVPDSVAPGSVIIQAREHQGSMTAMAAATVAVRADERQVTAEATATTEPTPTAAAAASRTVAPTLATQTQRTSTSEPTQPPQPTSQPQPTPRSNPTDQPRPTPQPQPTPRSNPTDQPRPTPQPQPTPRSNPTDQPRPKPDAPHDSPTPSSYTVKAGDSLSAIAQHVYGNANNWRALYEANRGAIGGDPNLIHPGTELVVPPRD
jgi:nucleoid-associated protein YgaU